MNEELPIGVSVTEKIIGLILIIIGAMFAYYSINPPAGDVSHFSEIFTGAGLIIAPYLFARDIDDGRFIINLDLIRDTVTYTDSEDIELPIFAMINLGISCVSNPRFIRMIVEQYEPHFQSLRGFFICIENLDDRNVGYEELLGLVELCTSFAANHDVVSMTIASFGQVLCSVGINWDRPA